MLGNENNATLKTADMSSERTSTTLPEVFRWHTSNLQLFAFPHFPSPQWFLPVCGSLREVGEVGRFAFGCGIVCFVGRAGWWWILNGSSAGYSNGDGVGKDMAGNQQKWVSVLQFGKPLQEFIAVLSFLFSVLWAKTALSERYASLQFLWMYLTEKRKFSTAERRSCFRNAIQNFTSFSCHSFLVHPLSIHRCKPDNLCSSGVFSAVPVFHMFFRRFPSHYLHKYQYMFHIRCICLPP